MIGVKDEEETRPASSGAEVMTYGLAELPFSWPAGLSSPPETGGSRASRSPQPTICPSAAYASLQATKLTPMRPA